MRNMEKNGKHGINRRGTVSKLYFPMSAGNCNVGVFVYLNIWSPRLV